MAVFAVDAIAVDSSYVVVVVVAGYGVLIRIHWSVFVVVVYYEIVDMQKGPWLPLEDHAGAYLQL
jgi:hypothetical protein